MLNLFTGKPHYSFLGIGKKDNTICSFLLLATFRYFVIGYQSGSLKVWKLFAGKKIIHTFEGHTRPVESLMLHQDPRFFWSTSGDQSIRLWNLESFSHLYTFVLPGIHREITMLWHDRFMAEDENMICLGRINNTKRLIVTHGAKVIAGERNEGCGLILTLSNNSGLCLWSDTFNDDLNEYTKV